ncbi:hypothetical protein [Castellaniella sp.]|uniref:hypothetical protein n=1 Tax=Castellaniella sp. TaxID=1955812 RepID=UPI002AFED744|nr:hypothetical protein [Castellaniella sp.]
MQNADSTLDTQLAQRLKLASQRQNMGEDLRRQDYAWLLAVTVLAPALMMVAGWYL